ncbi:MAG TPA: hypothetical protein VEX86_04105 [Longimicrobium sp.]|nr:hypothetical protein [Longimicrobium sp.]
MTTHENGSGSDHVLALVGQRDQLRGWIAKLDEVQTGAPSRVAERVRADYDERLRRVTEELSAHGEEIQRQLQALRDQLAAAEERRTHAADQLEETRLRHLIGELDEPAWDQARGPLEQEVAAADRDLDAARAEVEHLGTLAGEISGAAGVEEPEAEEEAAEADVPAAGAALDEGGDEAGFDGGLGDEDADGEEDVGDDLPFYAADEPEPARDAGADAAEAAAWEPELEMASDSADGGAGEGTGGISGGGAVSGEELAAWISEVEAESTSGGGSDALGLGDVEMEPVAEPGSAPADEADGWDPFANEFGGSPAPPAAKPGETTQDLPWLDGLQGGAAGKWADVAPGESDDLAFLDNLDAPAPGAATPAADLAADDLAFLEELDRAISGGAQRSPGTPAPATPAGGLDDGSGTDSGLGLEGTQEQPKKRGEALLCKECGAINEPQAWYCEICGSEL